MNLQHKQASMTLRLQTPFSRIALAWLLGLVALGLAGFLGELSEKHWGWEGPLRYGFQALVMSGLVVPGVWLLRIRIDRGSPEHIGTGTLRQSLARFALGMGLLLVPLSLTLIFTVLFGWGTVKINIDDSLLHKLLIGMGITFLFEALPEELLFRGYIYSNLNMRFKRWVSALATVGLFALLPVILVPIQSYVFRMDINLGGSNTITFSYLITMMFFGAFVQYLRILTGSIWTGIGFHLLFVYINRIMGIEPTKLIQFTGFTNETPVQITFVSTLAVIFILLLLYPRIRKRKIGWNDLQIS